MHSDDIAAACLYLMNHFDKAGFINVGTGKDCSIYDLAMIIKGIVGYEGDVIFDSSKPDGTPRKLMDVSKLNALGWRSSISLEEGIRTVYEDYKLNLS
jgi:GDP-L-fucose synthase